MTELHLPGRDEEPPAPVAARHGSALPAEALLSAAVDLPWDDWLGPGAGDRVRDGSLGLVRHAYPATAGRRHGGGVDHRGDAPGDARRPGAARRGRAPGRRGAPPSRRGCRTNPGRSRSPGGSPRRRRWSGCRGRARHRTGSSSSRPARPTPSSSPPPTPAGRCSAPGFPAGARGDAGPTSPSASAPRSPVAPAPTPRALERARWQRAGDVIAVRWREGEKLRSATVSVNRPPPPRLRAR